MAARRKRGAETRWKKRDAEKAGKVVIAPGVKRATMERLYGCIDWTAPAAPVVRNNPCLHKHA